MEALSLKLLQDPIKDRVAKDVKPPPQEYFGMDHLYVKDSKTTKINWQILSDHLRAGGRVNEECCIQLIKEATEVFKNEANVLEIDEPAVCVGDIHGHFYDLVKIFEFGGSPENMNYIFLGDYIDRGNFSVEVLLLLYSIKITVPKKFVMLRGNHESSQLAQHFNFEKEVLHKYNQKIYDLFINSFQFLPIACIFNKKFLTIHAGLSPELTSISQLKSLNRIVEPPKSGLFCDILWSDPVENEKGICNPTYKPNMARGCSYNFGKEASNTFLKQNGLISIFRGHEAQAEGYKMHKWNGDNEFPNVITIFSAANYCDAYNNKGAIIKFENNTLNIQQYTSIDHPYILPNFEDIFRWSVPFLAEKVVEMFSSIFKKIMMGNENASPTNEKKLDSSKDSQNPEYSQILQAEKIAKIKAMKGKILTASKIVKLFKLLREESEDILKLKGACPDNKIPRGLLTQGSEAIKNTLTSLEAFEKMKLIDQVNEGYPEENKKEDNSILKEVTKTV